MLKASTDLRLAQQEMAAFYSEMFGYPTREELDDVHRTSPSFGASCARSGERSGREPKTDRAAAKPDDRSEASPLPRTGTQVIMTNSGAPVHIKPEQAISEAAALGEKIARGATLFSKLRDDGVAIATTPKDEVWRQDKVTLHHYRPLAEKKIATPVLIVYGLIGRYTMADLQEDRSLVRNLLKLGVDLYVVDWGNPSRADRWLTLDDYIDGYLAECVRGNPRTARDRQGESARHLRRRRFHDVLRGAASRHRQIHGPHHHADRFSRRYGREPARPRLHQPVDAQPPAGGYRPADRRLRQSAGRVHGVGVLADDADAHV